MTATTSLRDAAARVIAAFKAHGSAAGLVADARTRKECEAAMLALDVALSTPPAGEWMPIASAPKGELLLYWPATKPTRGAAGNTLHEMIRTGYAGGTPNRPPTHWQPLPPPPATQEVG